MRYSVGIISINTALILFFLGSVAFFMPMNESFSKIILYFCFALLLCFSKTGLRFPKYGGNLPFCLFIGIVLFSILPAKFYWGQSVTVSIIAILPFLIYSLYFVLIGIKCDKTVLYRIICNIGKIYVILYLLKTVVPILPFGTIVSDASRGNRLVMNGDFFCIFLYFALLNDILKNKYDKNKIIWLILSLIVIILPMTRQRMFMAFILGAFMVIKKAPRKYLPHIIAFFIMLGIAASGLSISNNLSKMTNEQLSSENPYDHIREIGIIYYFSEFPDKGINKIVGNGIPSYGRSKYGNDSKQFADETKIYLIDIGFAGIYNYFGYIGLLCYCWMILYPVFSKKATEYEWCKYMMVFILGSSILSGVPMIPCQFIFIPICAYFLIPSKILRYGSKHNIDKLQYSSPVGQLHR